MCDCKKCGGTDEFAICENGMLEAQKTVWKGQNVMDFLKLVGIILAACIIGSFLQK
jgi:hypothetical protein